MAAESIVEIMDLPMLGDPTPFGGDRAILLFCLEAGCPHSIVDLAKRGDVVWQRELAAVAMDTEFHAGVESHRDRVVQEVVSEFNDEFKSHTQEIGHSRGLIVVTGQSLDLARSGSRQVFRVELEKLLDQ